MRKSKRGFPGVWNLRENEGFQSLDSTEIFGKVSGMDLTSPFVVRHDQGGGINGKLWKMRLGSELGAALLLLGSAHP